MEQHTPEPFPAEFQLGELDLLSSFGPPTGGCLDAAAMSQLLFSGLPELPPFAAATTPPFAATSAPFPDATSFPSTSAPLELTSSGNTSSGTTVALSKEEEKQEKARAANRAKQARFRQRQKERKEEMAAQYEAAAADLEREQQLNETMKVSCAVMEAVKVQKDTAVQVLEAAAGLDQGQQPHQGLAPQLQQQLSQLGTASELSSSIMLQELWSLPFSQRVDLCTRIACQTAPVKNALDTVCNGGEGVCRPDGFALDVEMKKQLMVAHHPSLLAAALSVSPEALIRERGELGELSADLVQRYDAGELTEENVNEALCDPVMYFAILGGILVNHRPQTLQHLLDHSRVPGETDEQASARWRDVALCMGVVPKEQGARILVAFQNYRNRVQQLSVDTATALESLRQVQECLSEQMSGLSSSVQQYLRVFEAAGQLSHQSHAALLITMDFMSTAGNLVTPLQKARMNARCKPLHPDVVSIVRE